MPPLQKKWLDFPSCSDATKRRYTKRSSDIVAAVLNTISPENAGYIWKAMTSSASMNKLVDIEDISQADHRYLETLAEAYCNANSWDTCRQILSVMTGVAGYKVITSFISRADEVEVHCSKSTLPTILAWSTCSFSASNKDMMRSKTVRSLFILYHI